MNTSEGFFLQISADGYTLCLSRTDTIHLQELRTYLSAFHHVYYYEPLKEVEKVLCRAV
jgi:hypothetical protein